jgi:sterol desaturase/sphingolipid hydroxylase (fatty acid hydroxylase superfamily)
MQLVPTFLFPVVYLTATAIERVFPARPLPSVRWWLIKGLVFFGIAGALNALVPELVARTLGGRGLDLSGLGLVGGALVGLAATDLTVYWVHRGQHASRPLWRWTHQLHHSAERVDVAGFSYNHPLDLAITAALGPLVASLLGVTPEAAQLAGFSLFVISLVAHTNVRTPVWLGYIIQRPEAHSVHHGRGVHAFNYASLPVWDLAFGTFRNPHDFVPENGFWNGASRRVGSMLIGRGIESPTNVGRAAPPQAVRG